MASKKILITGVSGTGKSTVCRELEKRGFDTVGIDETDHLSYWVRKDSGEPFIGDNAVFDSDFLAKHEWICDMQVLKKLIDKIDGPVVVCGNAENILEVIEFCDTTLLLKCSPDTFLARVEERNDNEYGQTEDAKNFILSYYESDNKKCIDAGAITIDAEQSIEKVVEDIIRRVG